MKKSISIILALVLCVCALSSCNGVTGTSQTTIEAIAETTAETAGTTASDSNEASAPQSGGDITTEHTSVKFTMENGDTFTLELYPEYAPLTVENFVSLVKSGFYNGLTFHRVIDNFMAQGGDPEGTGMGGSENKIYGEFSENGWDKNTLKHTRGVVSMARSSNPDSASSQFFICYTEYPSLDGKYAAFGKVTEGMETVDSFLKVERTAGSDGNIGKPKTPIVIKTAEVVTSAAVA